jgi:hypothetical protein
MTYEPQVNDYVIWSKGVEGWVYFKDKEYITIEESVRPKDDINYQCCSIHRNERVLVVCYAESWKELKYIKSRPSTNASFVNTCDWTDYTELECKTSRD